MLRSSSFITVVFPAPLRPSRQTRSPRSIPKSARSRTGGPPKAMMTDLSARRDMDEKLAGGPRHPERARVIPSERSESRDLHFAIEHLFAGGSRGGRGAEPRAAEDCSRGRAPRTGSPALSIHNFKILR